MVKVGGVGEGVLLALYERLSCICWQISIVDAKASKWGGHPFHSFSLSPCCSFLPFSRLSLFEIISCNQYTTDQSYTQSNNNYRSSICVFWKSCKQTNEPCCEDAACLLFFSRSKHIQPHALGITIPNWEFLNLWKHNMNWPLGISIPNWES